MEYFLVVDTETGGLDSKENGLLEIAAVIYDYQGNCVDTFEAVIKHPTLQGLPTSEKLHLSALRVNKIFNRLEKAQDAFQVAQDFAKWSINAVNQYKPQLVGQNLKFDLGFIDAFMEKHNFEGWDNLFHYHRIDTIPIALFLKKTGILNVDKVNLESLAKSLNVEHSAAHSALSDAKTTAMVYLQMIQKVEQLTKK